MLTNKDISLIVRGRLHSSCVQSSIAWPVRKENEVALHRVRWMCGMKLRVPSEELRERLELDDIISVLQQKRLRWYWHVL